MRVVPHQESYAVHPAWLDREAIARHFLRAMLLVMPLGVWLSTMGNPISYFQFQLPPGQVLYILSKLMGLYAIVLLWLQVMYGLLKNDNLLHYLLPRWSLDAHRRLGMLTSLVVVAHFGLFITAASLRKHGVAYQWLVPDFTHGFYNAMVSVGWLALLGLISVAVTGFLQGRLMSGWTQVHRLSFVVIILALVHSLMVGSETKEPVWVLFYLLFGITIIIGFIRRWRTSK